MDASPAPGPPRADAREPSARRRALGALAVAAALIAAALGAWAFARERAIRADAEEAGRLVEAGRLAEAEAALGRWRAARPGSAGAAFLEARLLLASGRPAEGFEALDRAAELGHPAAEVDRLRAIALAGLGRHAEAEPVLRRLLEASDAPDPEAVAALARCYFETFRLRAARAAIDRWAREAPDDPRPYLWRARVGLRDATPRAELARDYRRALALDPSNPEARLGLAELELADARFGPARELCAAVVEADPDDPAARLGLGRALAGLGLADEAAAHLDRAAELMPRDARPLLERALVDARRGRHDDALARLDRAVAVDPAAPEARYQRGLALARLGRADESRADLEAAARLRGDLEEMNALLASLNARPDDPDLQHRAARWLIEHGQPEEGLRWARKVLAARPDHAETLRLLAEHHDRAGEPGLANQYRARAGLPLPGPSLPPSSTP